MDTDKLTFDFSGTSGANKNQGATATATFTPVNEPALASREDGLSSPQTAVLQTAEEGRGYRGAHPVAALFHVLFKIGAILTFIFGGLFGGYVVTFVITILFIAADFWTTKNITGRLLVSLRWWNQVNEDGTSQWVFESSPDSESHVNPYDSKFFWITLVGYAVFWVIMCILNILSPSWLPIAVVGLLLSGANVLGYFKCQRDAGARMTGFLAERVAQNPGAAQQAVASFFSGGGGATAGGNNKAEASPVQ